MCSTPDEQAKTNTWPAYLVTEDECRPSYDDDSYKTKVNFLRYIIYSSYFDHNSQQVCTIITDNDDEMPYYREEGGEDVRDNASIHAQLYKSSLLRLFAGTAVIHDQGEYFCIHLVPVLIGVLHLYQ